jgi:hypothetical protein
MSVSLRSYELPAQSLRAPAYGSVF